MKTTLESAVRLNDHYGEPGPPEEPIFFRSHNNFNINFLPISVIHYSFWNLLIEYNEIFLYVRWGLQDLNKRSIAWTKLIAYSPDSWVVLMPASNLKEKNHQSTWIIF